jgi:predicted acyl esterase
MCDAPSGATSTSFTWTHIDGPSLPDDALERMLPRYLEPALDFFDAFLANRTDPASVPRVRWHLGNDGWHESPTWPPPGAREACLHLTADRLETSPGAPGEAAWVHDPEDLVPSTIVDPFSFLLEYPDENEVAARADVVVFTGEPLAEPLTLAGRVVARLWVFVAWSFASATGTSSNR